MRSGTAKQLADQAIGYAGNGVSLFTRRVAHNHSHAKERTVGELITLTMRQLGDEQKKRAASAIRSGVKSF